jgi:hypothetical protein
MNVFQYANIEAYILTKCLMSFLAPLGINILPMGILNSMISKLSGLKLGSLIFSKKSNIYLVALM